MTITYTSVSNPVYADATSTSIWCLVQFGNFAAPVLFTATPTDIEAHGKQIFTDCVAGKYGPVAPYVAPNPTATPVPTATPTLDPAMVTAVAKAVMTALSTQTAAAKTA